LTAASSDCSFFIRNNFVEGIVSDGFLDALDPFITVFFICRGQSVIFMIALYHGTIAVGLAPFDDFRHITVDLEHELLPVAVLHAADSHVLQGDDALRHILGGVLEVIQTTVVEDKPTPLPTFPASSLLHKPALPFGGKESVHEVIIRLVRNFERFFLDIPKNSFQHIRGQVPPRVDPLVLLYELFGCYFHFCVRIVAPS